MNSEDMKKELWSIANIITGFAGAQPLAIAVALGKDLEKLQGTTITFKAVISFIALGFAVLYCLAVHRCYMLARPMDTEHERIWRQVTLGRKLFIFLFTAVLVFGLFAPDIFGRWK